MEYLIIGPLAYILIRLWNAELDKAYSKAELEASILLGQGQNNEARAVMDRALVDLRRFKIRKVLGFKL